MWYPPQSLKLAAGEKEKKAKKQGMPGPAVQKEKKKGREYNQQLLPSRKKKQSRQEKRKKKGWREWPSSADMV